MHSARDVALWMRYQLLLLARAKSCRCFLKEPLLGRPVLRHLRWGRSSASEPQSMGDSVQHPTCNRNHCLGWVEKWRPCSYKN